MKRTHIILKKLAKYIKPVVTFARYEVSANIGNPFIYFLKGIYSITIDKKRQFQINKRSESLNEDKIIEFLKENRVLEIFEWLAGGNIKNKIKKYNTYSRIEFDKEELNKIFKECAGFTMALLVKGKPYYEANGYSYDIKRRNCYIHISQSDKLTCVCIPDLGKYICAGKYGEKLAGKPEWISTIAKITALSLSRYETNSYTILEKMLKDKNMELLEIYKKYVRPYLPSLLFEIVEKLEDNSIPQYMLDYGFYDLELIDYMRTVAFKKIASIA